MLHSWQGLELLQHLAVHFAEARSLEVGPVCVDRQREHAVGDESQRLRLQIAQGDRKERGGHDQQRRQRDLYHDERFERCAAERTRSSAGRQHVPDIDLARRARPGRGQCPVRSAWSRPALKSSTFLSGRICRSVDAPNSGQEPDQHIDAPRGGEHTERSTGHRDEERFREQLARQAGRLAPSARQTERSRCRAAARARKRLARLAHPSTSSTATIASIACTGLPYRSRNSERPDDAGARSSDLNAWARARSDSALVAGEVLLKRARSGRPARPRATRPVRGAPPAPSISRNSAPLIRRAGRSDRHAARPAVRRIREA